MAAHFKPFSRATAGVPANRHSTRHSCDDDHDRYRRRYRRRRSGLIVLDLG